MSQAKLEKTRYELQRSALISGGISPNDTWATCVFLYEKQAVFTTPHAKGHVLSKSRARFRFEFRSRKRFVVLVSVWRLSSGYPILLRRFQLSVPTPQGPIYSVDFSLTDLSYIIQMYDKWAAGYINYILRPPWAPSGSRPSPESSSAVRYESWVEFGTLRSYAEVPYTNYSRTYAGTRTPRFKTLKKRDLPVNNYSLVMFRRGHYGEYIRNVRHDSGGQLTRDDQLWLAFSVPGGDTEPGFSSGLRDNAVKRLAQNAGSDVTSNIALNVAQIQQTIDLIGGSAVRIAGSLRALKGGNLPKAAKLLWQNQRVRLRPGAKFSTTSSLASNWLELQYGWKPLLSDIRGSMEALARYNFANAAVKRVAASASIKTDEVIPITTNDFDPTTVGTLSIEARDVCRIGVRYRLASPLTAFLAQTGFTNPLNLAWELIPFSFVVDWFLPVGNYLETIGRWGGLEFLDGFQTNFIRKRTLGRTYFSGKYKASDEGWHTDRYGLYSSFWLKHSRVRLTSFPGANLPELRNGLNVTRSLNALALLRVVFGK